MKKMWADEELIKLIEEHGGQLTPDKLIRILLAGENITLNIVSSPEGSKLKISSPTITAHKLFDLIKGSESVVVDLSEDEEYLEIHLDADILAKIDRALLLPLSVSSFRLIGVDNETGKKNAPTQKLIGLDSDTLEIDESGNLKVKGGGSDIHLYEHRIYISEASGQYIYQIWFNYISNSNTPMNYDDIASLSIIPVAKGGMIDNTQQPSSVSRINVYQVGLSSVSQPQIELYLSGVSSSFTHYIFTRNANITDNVRQII